MADLALASGLQWVSGEECKAMFLEARPLCAKLGGILVCNLRHRPAESPVAVPRPVLVKLALGSDAGYGRAGTRAVGKIAAA